MKRLLPLAAFGLLLAFAANEVSAAELLKCEKRIRPARSRVSVELEGLTPGAMYTALIGSGRNAARASIAADIAGVAEFDFDSNPADIVAGAARIAPNFIGTKVSLIVTDALGNREAATTANCRIR